MTIALALSVEAEEWARITDLEQRIQQALDAAARSSGLVLADDAEVSMLLCDDARMRELNRAWRGKDTATNVLSFPTADSTLLEKRLLLGDIAIAWETTAREAVDEGKQVETHLMHLTVHGFLHLVGFDHEIDSEAASMEALETRILDELGIDDPYAAPHVERSSA